MIEAIDIWIKRKLMCSLQESPYFSILEDEVQDISTQEELSIYGGWLFNGKPEEHFLRGGFTFFLSPPPLFFIIYKCYCKHLLAISKVLEPLKHYFKVMVLFCPCNSLILIQNWRDAHREDNGKGILQCHKMATAYTRKFICH